MAFCKTIVHVVQPGDTFYRLAQRYQTTVPEIILRNPGVNPYNLQVGTRLSICSGQQNNTVFEDEIGLNNDMRKAWMQHVYWLRMFMTSLFQNLEDLDAVEARLMKTPEDIAGVMDKFYPQAQIMQLMQLLGEHTELGGQIMKSLKTGEMQTVERLERQWYQNAEKIAALLAGLNTEYTYEDILQELSKHMDMTRRQMTAALGGDHDEEVRIFDENENHVMDLADYLTSGLIKQFYRS